MLGYLFLLTVFVIIVAFAITILGDDFDALRREMRSMIDPDLQRMRALREQTKRHH
jgi:hypothetical protein